MNDREWPNKPKEVLLLAGELVGADQNGACASMNGIIDDLPKTICRRRSAEDDPQFLCDLFGRLSRTGNTIRRKNAFLAGF